MLNAVYRAAFAEGWADPGDLDAVRVDLNEEAFFLAKLVAALLPDEPETLGLLALHALHGSPDALRDEARLANTCRSSEQDPSLWNSQMIVGAEALLRRASELDAIGRFQLEAVTRRRMSSAAGPVATTGPTYCDSMTPCYRSRTRRLLRSIARSRLQKFTVRQLA